MENCGLKGKFRAVSLALKENLWWWLPLLLGAALRAEYLREFSASPLFSLALGADVSEYDMRAREILGGLLFPLKPAIHGPLYSFFLAGVYWLFPLHPVPAARAVQLLLALPAGCFLAQELHRYGLKKSLCGWFLAGMVMLPNLIYFQAELVSESLLFPELALALAFLLRFRRTGELVSGVAGGIFCGLGVLTHGFALFYLAAEVVAFACRKQWKRLLAVLCGALILIVPVVVAKSVHYGSLTGVQGNGAFNLWLGNNPDAKGICYLPPGKEWRQVHNETKLEARERQVSEDRVWLEKTAVFWKEHPFRGVGLGLRKFILFFSPNELPSGADPGFLVCYTDVVFLGRIVIPAVFLLAFLGFWDFLRRRRREFLSAALLAGGILFGTILTVTSGRYRMGAWPGILVFAALGTGVLNWKRWWSLPVLAVFLTLPLSFSFMATGKRETAELLGEAALRRGELDHAADLLTYAARKGKNPAMTSNLLGNIAEQKGDLLSAEKYYRDATEAEPLHPSGWMNLGILYGEKTRYDEAERCFGRAMMLGDDPALAAYNYGLLMIRRERWEEARRLETIAITHAPTDPKMWNALGITEFSLGNYSEAAAAFRKAEHLSSDRTPAHASYAANARAAQRRVDTHR